MKLIYIIVLIAVLRTMKSPLQDVQVQAETNSFPTVVDIYALNDEVRYGYIIFRDLVKQFRKHIMTLQQYDSDDMHEKVTRKINFDVGM